MSIENLLDLVGLGTPGTWITRSRHWQPIEAQFGELPFDYKSYVASAGLGCLENFFWIFDPFTSNQFLNLGHQVTTLLPLLAAMKTSSKCLNHVSFFPEIDGLLPFGITTNGDILCWITADAPSNWRVLLYGARHSLIEEYSNNMSSFLLMVLQGQVESTILPKGLGYLEPPLFRRSE